MSCVKQLATATIVNSFSAASFLSPSFCDTSTVYHQHWLCYDYMYNNYITTLFVYKMEIQFALSMPSSYYAKNHLDKNWHGKLDNLSYKMVSNWTWLTLLSKGTCTQVYTLAGKLSFHYKNNCYYFQILKYTIIQLYLWCSGLEVDSNGHTCMHTSIFNQFMLVNFLCKCLVIFFSPMLIDSSITVMHIYFTS